jgi:hypothetical protein
MKPKVLTLLIGIAFILIVVTFLVTLKLADAGVIHWQ